MDAVLAIAILMLSVVVHEVAHGYAAQALGDPTARLAGRLSMNPLKHLDPIGSVILPALTWFSGGFIFGWAKPVPYNPYNLRAGRWGDALVAVAGPGSNLLLAAVFGALIRFAGGAFSDTLIHVFALITLTNVGLAVFNLVPIPPLDGSKILFSVLPYQFSRFQEMLERYGFALVILFVVLFSSALAPVARFLFTLLSGVPLL